MPSIESTNERNYSFERFGSDDRPSNFLLVFGSGRGGMGVIVPTNCLSAPPSHGLGVKRTTPMLAVVVNRVSRQVIMLEVHTRVFRLVWRKQHNARQKNRNHFGQIITVDCS